MSNVEILLLALLLDAVLGEPEGIWSRIPHPVVLMGRAIEWVEARFNRGGAARLLGALALLLLIVLVGGIAFAIALIPDLGILELIGAAILLSHRSLSDHVRAVARALPYSLDASRRAVGQIVGRETHNLDDSGVSRAAIETTAENFSDGVVAPAFWFLVAGLPGIAIYKLVNTADSMIGHRTERLEAFGWASARLDDLLNFAPARIAGLLIALGAWSADAIEVMVSEAALHRSATAGWPEGALAGALGVALSGPRVYDGVATDDPYLNAEARRKLDFTDIYDALAIIWSAWAVLAALIAVPAIVFAFYV
ncbi:MAG: adenosylcobinamide-phosphate synthase CbiB [Pseudomonadota bacterium]